MLGKPHDTILCRVSRGYDSGLQKITGSGPGAVRVCERSMLDARRIDADAGHVV